MHQLVSVNPLANIDVGAFCCTSDSRDADATGCCCGDQERILRAYIRQLPDLPPMTTEQRDWCLSEIGSVEGWRREDHVADTDPVLARAVLDAWTDYCRDKGLL